MNERLEIDGDMREDVRISREQYICIRCAGDAWTSGFQQVDGSRICKECMSAETRLANEIIDEILEEEK